ncbi:MAG: hypothetical protein ABI946_00815 [Chthoniobacterales bacterium]
MPDIRFSCPHCDQHIVSDEAIAGASVTCPTCNARFDAPAQPKRIPDAPTPETSRQTYTPSPTKNVTPKKSNEIGCFGGVFLGIICTFIFVVLGPKDAPISQYAVMGLGTGLFIALMMFLSSKFK